MQWLKDLDGTGIGKTCLMIGGGRSVMGFDFSKLSQDVVSIGINESGLEACGKYGVRLDYMVYYDNDFNRIFHKTKPCKVICSNHALNIKADYQYRLKEIECKQDDNTGKKALVIAHDFFKFDEIYLIGYDFSTEVVNGTQVSHFYGDPVGKDKKYVEEMKLRDHFKQLEKMISQFDDLDYDNVYNLNLNSLLKKFPYKEDINVSNNTKKHSNVLT